MSARDLAARLGLHRAGRGWRGTCPACGYRDALIVSEGRDGAPIAWCAACQNRDAMRALLRSHGAVMSTPMGSDHPARRAERNRARALDLWRSSKPAPGTPADSYLTARGLPGLAASPALRYSADMPHPDGRRYPAMIAVVSDAAGAPMAIHRTFLRRDGTAKADVEPPRATLGPILGGAVRLNPVAAEMVVGEGIETSEAAGRLIGLPAWAAISAGNLACGVVLPAVVRSVSIAVDTDPPGRDAAHAAWCRWRAEGRHVRFAMPDRDGIDMADVLVAREAV